MNEPCPSPAGIKRAQELYLRQFDAIIDPAEAQALLTALMRILQAAEKKGLRLAAPGETVPGETVSSAVSSALAPSKPVSPSATPSLPL